MTSEIRANTLKNRVGLGTISFTNTGAVVSGIVTIANSTAAGVTLEDNAGVGNSLKITTPTGYVSIGSGNSTFVHLNTDRGVFYFQKRIFVDEGVIASYDEDLVLQSPSNTNRVIIDKDTGLVSILNDLDVDGHTNLDNVSIAGVTTITGSGSSVLFLESSNPMIRLTDTDNNAYSSIGGESGFLYLYTNSSSRDVIFRGSQEVARITGDGMLGIGTVNPTARIHLHKASGDAIQKIESSNGAASLELRHTNGYGYINYRQDGAETFRVGQIAQFTSYSVYNPNSSLPYQFCVEGNGEVGINTHNPANTLHLLRNSTNHGITLQRGGTNAGSASINVTSFGALDLTASNNFNITSGGSQQIIFNRGSTEVGRFNTSGYLGVGDFSSDTISQAFHVKGSQPEILLEHTGGYDMTLTTNDGAGQNGITVNGGYLSLAYNNKNVVMCRTGGRVGINDTSPPWPLSIRGAVSGGTVSGGSGVFIGIQDNFAAIQMNTASDAHGCIIDMGYSGVDYKGRIEYINGDDYMRFFTNSGERLRIESGGEIRLTSENGNNSDTPGFTFRGGSSSQKANFARIHSRMVSNWGGQLQFKVKDDNGSLSDAYRTAMIMNHNAYVTKPEHPAFFATNNGTDGSTSDGNLIELNTTRYNKNNVYSTSSYYFTAPVAGVYTFTGQVWAKNGTSHARWQFSYHNGSAWSSITQHGFHGNSVNKTDFMQNASITYYMNSGDRMGMRVDNGPLAYYRGGGGAAHTYFCGHLVG